MSKEKLIYGVLSCVRLLVIMVVGFLIGIMSGEALPKEVTTALRIKYENGDSGIVVFYKQNKWSIFAMRRLVFKIDDWEDFSNNIYLLPKKEARNVRSEINKTR